ncbi:hypothetical protein J6590_108225 [Homalodisca vitripennis]|nr:hypothetical protein J6590_108225 [Homalodisca vitripennis]
MKTILTLVLYSLELSVLCVRTVLSVTEEEVGELQKVFTDIQKENIRLTAECDFLKQENAKLWTEINRLGSDVKDMQQYTRVDNVEIAGIPQRANENIYDIVQKICKALEVPYNRDEISEAHRLPKAKQGYPFIVVRFISRRIRDSWLAAARTRQCTLQQIYPDLPATPFFVNQHLTSYKKGLLDMAKRLVAEGIYAFAWVKDGKVYVRRTPTSSVIRIRSYSDFERANEYDLFNRTTEPPSF